MIAIIFLLFFIFASLEIVLDYFQIFSIFNIIDSYYNDPFLTLLVLVFLLVLFLFFCVVSVRLNSRKFLVASIVLFLSFLLYIIYVLVVGYV